MMDWLFIGGIWIVSAVGVITELLHQTNKEPEPMPRVLHRLFCFENGEKWVVVHRDGHWHLIAYKNDTVEDALQAVGRAASHPGLNFNWKDAAQVSMDIRARQRAERVTQA